MKNLWLQVFILSILLGANGSQADSLIFSYLESENYDGIKREIKLDQSWARRRNSQRHTPLQVAIRMKHRDLVTYLVKAGAKVNSQEIYLAMNYFFDVHQSSLDEASLRPIVSPRPGLAGRLIVAAAQGDDVESDFVELAQVLDLFSAREKLAPIMRKLFDTRKIKARHLKLLTQHYRKLYLQDVPPSPRQLTTIVGALLPLKVHHHLLRLIADAYAHTNSAAHILPVHHTPKAQAHMPPLVQEVAQAIIEKSRTLLLSLPPAIWVRTVILEEELEELNEASMEMEKLSAFIHLSILNPGQPEEISGKYLFWASVYDLLVDEGDLMGAFAVAAALNASSIQKRVGPKIYREKPITDMMDSFRNYRMLLNRASPHFHTPALLVHMRDLTAMKEISLVINTDGLEKLNKRAINFYLKFRKNMGATYQLAQLCDYRSTERMAQLFDNLPQSKEQLTGGGHDGLISKFFETQKARRRTMNFQALFPLDSPRKRTTE